MTKIMFFSSSTCNTNANCVYSAIESKTKYINANLKQYDDIMYDTSD